jgi:hypothetical protein
MVAVLSIWLLLVVALVALDLEPRFAVVVAARAAFWSDRHQWQSALIPLPLAAVARRDLLPLRQALMVIIQPLLALQLLSAAVAVALAVVVALAVALVVAQVLELRLPTVLAVLVRLGKETKAEIV